LCRDAPGARRGILLLMNPLGGKSVDALEIRKLEAYMRRLFGNARLRVVPRPKKDDSAEVYIGEEFIGVMFVDDEDAERSYNFQMAILGADLD
jgi:hypothetical protein